MENEDKDRRCNVHIFGSWFYSENEKTYLSVCWLVCIRAVNQYFIPFHSGLVHSGLSFTQIRPKEWRKQIHHLSSKRTSKKWKEWLVNIIWLASSQYCPYQVPPSHSAGYSTGDTYRRWLEGRSVITGVRTKQGWRSMVSALVDLTSCKLLWWG